MAGNHPIERIKENLSQVFLLTDRKIEKRIQKKIRIDEPNAERTVSYLLFLRSLVPRLVEQCQRRCGVKLKTSDDGDYLLVKSYDPLSCCKGETRTKHQPQYVHFNRECLLEHAHAKHDIKYNGFPFANIKVNRYDLLTEEEKPTLISYELNFA